MRYDGKTGSAVFDKGGRVEERRERGDKIERNDILPEDRRFRGVQTKLQAAEVQTTTQTTASVSQRTSFQSH